MLNLEWCRITQDDLSHYPNWHMYWWDIACERWKSIEIKSPKYFNRYVVTNKWYDKRLWDFIILKHWEFRFIYGHTKTHLEIWDRIDNDITIGHTTLSWLSNWQHVHIELRKRWSNIKFSHLDWEDIDYSYYSDALLKQRWWQFVKKKELDLEEILSYIADFEWYRLTSYKDWPRYSICWGIESSPNVTVTDDWCIENTIPFIQWIVDRYKIQDHPQYVANATTSFIYNVWSLNSNQRWLLENKHYCGLWNSFLSYNKSWGVVLNWLVKRRQIERDLLCR